jgi:hypothetical protein
MTYFANTDTELSASSQREVAEMSLLLVFPPYMVACMQQLEKCGTESQDSITFFRTFHFHLKFVDSGGHFIGGAVCVSAYTSRVTRRMFTGLEIVSYINCRI